jgi:hypothetical protein
MTDEALRIRALSHFLSVEQFIKTELRRSLTRLSILRSRLLRRTGALTSFGAVRLAMHSCNKLYGISAKANKIT